MLLFVVAACMIPLLIQGRLIAQSSRQMQVERRIIDVQNQCQILSNKMSRNGYLGNSGVDTSGTDTELSMLADIFNGRILIVNSGFRIVKDTFSLAEGKICISDETLRCFQGETTSRYGKALFYPGGAHCGYGPDGGCQEESENGGRHAGDGIHRKHVQYGGGASG